MRISVSLVGTTHIEAPSRIVLLLLRPDITFLPNRRRHSAMGENIIEHNVDALIVGAGF